MVIDLVMQRAGLNPQMITDYKNVTLDGGYRRPLTPPEKTPCWRAWSSADRAKPIWITWRPSIGCRRKCFQLLENPDDAQFAKYVLDKEAREMQREQHEKRNCASSNSNSPSSSNTMPPKNPTPCCKARLTITCKTMLARGV
ncbi:MAG: hypothetical protein U0Y68_20835 [Blastocatellia bacterium]